FQQLVRPVYVELPFRVLRDEAFGIVEKIPGRDRGASIDVSLDRGAIDEQTERLPDGRIAEQWMFRLGAGMLAIDLGPRVGDVDLDVLYPAALDDLGAPSGVTGVFEFDEDLVLDLHVPSVVVLTCLDHSARGRYGIAAALHFNRVEIRPIGH